MYKLLIIDDQNYTENRKDIYKFMFGGRFEIKCIDSEENNINDALKNEYFDCVILDNMLNSGLEKEMVISLINDYKYPIIMVSNVREFTEKEYEKEEIIDFISLNQYFKLRDLEKKTLEEDFVKQTLKDLHERVTYDIFSSRKYKSNEKSKLAICHLSDVQFCDPHIDKNDTRTLFTKLEDFIINRDTPIDVLVISGDIVFSGKEKEFENARNVIRDFQSKLKRRRKNVNIILVPGNHDFDYKSYMLNGKEMCTLDNKEIAGIVAKIKENIEGKKDIEFFEEIVNSVITPSVFSEFEADSRYLTNFKEFAYEITNDLQYLKKNFYVINNLFIKRGFSFVGINNAYKYHKNQDDTKKYIYQLNSDIVEEFKEPIFSISIGHIDPRSLGYQKICGAQIDRCNSELYRSECCESGCCQKWGDMQRFFRRTKSIMYLFGHKHCSDIEISEDKTTLFVGAASPTGASMSEKTINVIELESRDKDVDVKIAVYRATAEKIKFVSTNEYLYNEKINQWEKI